MSGATGAGEPEAFAELLRELKDRSGLSYGVLAKRLHMSTSTLHRYCNGTAVPVEYAPVERLARVCKATPQELVELHRRWILADAARGRRADRAGEAAVESAQAAENAGATQHAGDGNGDGGDGDGDGDGHSDSGDPVVIDPVGDGTPPRRSSWPHRRRTVLIASVALVAALGGVAYALRPTGLRAGDSTAPTIVDTRAADPGREPSPTPSAVRGGSGPSPSVSASPTGPAADSGSGASRSAGEPAARPSATGAPLAVATRPYVYDSPCSQHFLVDSEPAQVGPPASEQDAPRWAAAYGAVSSGEQRIALTVQGTGAETVVLNALHVRVLSRNAPLAWNDYAMGVGCGGGVGTKSFDIALDSGSPAVTVKNGQRAFPYKVSESDPEVFYVTAHTTAHDVRWDLTLDWSSGDRSGTVHIDNAGRPFRTSADVGRPGYDYPLGGSEWIERVGG
ncbi:helix-turn-helix domain-containing protein [Streptomyces griseorubiginosus]|uniref:DNA-binding protein n=1 Tax=Streptomyces griseorubiginosus TaxID=67304 RepID=A0A124HWT9_9ACTN|nr:helix-turn-helix transcriptional regulator [Streptomyces griseorubiginosus]KUN62651.1 DNA-binding protein [Streptomyces griseorubiginosus]